MNSTSKHRQFRSLYAILLLPFLIWSPTSFASLLTTNITITGNINGSAISGSGLSTSDTITGIADTTIVFSALPTDFPVIAYGKSWKTKHHKNYAVSTGGRKNFRELSPSGYSFDTLITYDSGLGTLHNTGSVVATGVNTDSYTLDIQGSYAGSIDPIGVKTSPALFLNVAGSPGDISMIDREIIEYATGPDLGLTEIGTFSLFSGATLPLEPDYLIVDVFSFSFDSNTNTLSLITQASETPEPTTILLLMIGLLGIYYSARLKGQSSNKERRHILY